MLLNAGISVNLFDHSPTLARKLLVAGSSGLNLSKDQDWGLFLSHYGEKEAILGPILEDFNHDALINWVKDLGIEIFIGSSGKIFPTGMKAGEFLHAWLQRLSGMGLKIYVNHDWQGWTEDGHVYFETPAGKILFQANILILAMGGASWPHTGSDGKWVNILSAQNVPVHPLKPANCGFETNWTELMKKKYAGQAIQTTCLSFLNIHGKLFRQRGEFVLTKYGVEGNLIYQVGTHLRELIERDGFSVVTLDLMPDWSIDRIVQQLMKPRGKRTIVSFLQRSLGLSSGKIGLIFEIVTQEERENPHCLAQKIKDLPLRLTGMRPLEEAISTAGGVAFEGLTNDLMVVNQPGVFCTGEMLDWEAPTGGYLIHACLATGRWAGLGAVKWLETSSSN